MADETEVATETLITLASDIVAAHVGNNQVAIDEVPVLIEAVFGTLSGLGSAQGGEPPRPEPAVSLRASVNPDYVVCLDCGRKMKVLKRHLSTDHGLSAREYRERWGLRADHPLVAPKYAKKRQTLAKKIGLGRKPDQKPARAKKA